MAINLSGCARASADEDHCQNPLRDSVSPMHNAPAAETTMSAKAWDVFLVFLRLGLTSFGGPIAHLAYFRDELVARRQWLDDAEFAGVDGDELGRGPVRSLHKAGARQAFGPQTGVSHFFCL